MQKKGWLAVFTNMGGMHESFSHQNTRNSATYIYFATVVQIMTDTLVIGLDAATWRVIDPMVKDGELPNFAALIEGGVKGSLSTTMPPMTPLAWTSMVTGVNPGRHGVFDFLSQDSTSREIGPIDFSKMTCPAVWDVFASENRSAGFLNFPLAHPPRQIDPFFIGGIPAHSKQEIAYPESVQVYLDEQQYDVHPHVDPEVDLAAFYRSVKELTKTQANVAIELAERHDPELLWAVFMGIDWVQHHLWDEQIDGEPALPAFYRFIDDLIGRLVEIVAPNGNVLIVSDHGARRVEGVIHLNSILEELGYLRQRNTTKGLRARVVDKILDTAWALGERLPPEIKRSAKRYAPADLQDEMKAAASVGQRGMSEQIDWGETKAFSYGYMGRIFINDDARYEEGLVSEADVFDVREALAADLAALEHPETGKQVFETVRTREEIYDGSYTDEAADLIAIPFEWEYSSFGDFGQPWIHEPKSRVADHDEEGIFIFNGEASISGETTMDVTDIAPTLLYLHDLPIIEGMDGEARTDLFCEQAREARNLTMVDSVPVSVATSETSAGERQEIEERLEDLGYM